MEKKREIMGVIVCVEKFWLIGNLYYLTIKKKTMKKTILGCDEEGLFLITK